MKAAMVVDAIYRGKRGVYQVALDHARRVPFDERHCVKIKPESAFVTNRKETGDRRIMK